jgi:hypothetical protein
MQRPLGYVTTLCFNFSPSKFLLLKLIATRIFNFGFLHRRASNVVRRFKTLAGFLKLEYGRQGGSIEVIIRISIMVNLISYLSHDTD